MTDRTIDMPGRQEVDATFRKVAWRLVPILMLAYVLAFIDRGNVGFAKPQFMGDLHFSEATFGLGGGLFYLGYSVFEIPSNLWLARIGARTTLLRIMVCWGLCSAALAFMTAPSHYYILRFLLGAAEAGLFPGVLFYLTTWIPPSRRSQFTALFMSAIAISGIVSGPLSGAILGATDGLLGLRGWQWLFLIEGLPSALTGIVIYFVLADSPQTAKWLSARELAIITSELHSEANAGQQQRHHNFGAALRDRRLYILSGMSVGLIAGGAGIRSGFRPFSGEPEFTTRSHSACSLPSPTLLPWSCSNSLREALTVCASVAGTPRCRRCFARSAGCCFHRRWVIPGWP